MSTSIILIVTVPCPSADAGLQLGAMKAWLQRGTASKRHCHPRLRRPTCSGLMHGSSSSQRPPHYLTS
eukprot:3062868-Pyramimonas_sp.AAC.1